MKPSQLVEPEFRFESIMQWENWRDIFCERLVSTALLDIPHLRILPEHQDSCVIVGAGPSLNDKLPKEPNDLIMSLNGAHAWLLRNEIVPNIHVLSEYDVEDVELALGGPPDKAVTYYLASHCHPNVFKQLRGYRRVLWHAALAPQEFQQEIGRLYPGEPMVNAGYATFFKSFAIGSILGYRNFEIFGVDSSCGLTSHVAGYAVADVEPKIKIWAIDPSRNEAKEFTTQGGLAFQAKEFLDLCRAYPEWRIRVHGDGMLQYLHKSRYPQYYED